MLSPFSNFSRAIEGRRLTLLDSGVGDGLTVAGVAVILKLAGNLHAVGLELRQSIVAEIQGERLPTSPAVV